MARRQEPDVKRWCFTIPNPTPQDDAQLLHMMNSPRVRFLVSSIETLLIQIYYRQRTQNQEPKNKEQENSPPFNSLFIRPPSTGSFTPPDYSRMGGRNRCVFWGKQPEIGNRKYEEIHELRFILKEFD
jgi:hypothetical protein